MRHAIRGRAAARSAWRRGARVGGVATALVAVLIALAAPAVVRRRRCRQTTQLFVGYSVPSDIGCRCGRLVHGHEQRFLRERRRATRPRRDVSRSEHRRRSRALRRIGRDPPRNVQDHRHACRYHATRRHRSRRHAATTTVALRKAQRHRLRLRHRQHRRLHHRRARPPPARTSRSGRQRHLHRNRRARQSRQRLIQDHRHVRRHDAARRHRSRTIGRAEATSTAGQW